MALNLALEAVARALCKEKHGHDDLDALTLMARQLTVVRAERLLNAIRPIIVAAAIREGGE